MLSRRTFLSSGLAALLWPRRLWAQPLPPSNLQVGEPMAFPSIAATSTGTNASGTSHTVTLPTGIASGDLLIVLLAMVSNDSTVTYPTGWTELFDTQGLNTAAHSGAYRRADGTEGASITVTSAGAITTAYGVYRITGHHATSDPEDGTPAVGESANPNPPSVTASWGAEDNLWIATWGGQSSDTTAWPTNYTLSQLEQLGFAVGAREVNAATEDPGTFTQGNTVWVAQTIVVRPAAAAAAGWGRLMSHTRNRFVYAD